MSQQFPPPGQQPPPGYGYPPPPAPKKSSTGKIVGFSCLGIVGLVVVIGVAGAVLSGGGDDGKKATPPAASAAAPKQPEAPASSAAPEKKAAVAVTAKATAFKPTIMGDGDYTSVSVTVTNNSKDTISVNPLYFAITDTAGTKHAAELMADEDQIDTVDLAPGENITGAVTGKGKWTAKSVTYTDGLIGKAIRADVS
ncbi:DUF4352 domain-containing protein [Streptomyces sp. NPDC090054]|uniref:DUF4352 domain-containing protein n=1 Tax=Streptomyces sp. NPDC090054 TaxID=3365933 RepID=UPI00380569B3